MALFCGNKSKIIALTLMYVQLDKYFRYLFRGPFLFSKYQVILLRSPHVINEKYAGHGS